MASRTFTLQLKDASAKLLDDKVQVSVSSEGVVLVGGAASAAISPLTWAKLLRVRRPRLVSRLIACAAWSADARPRASRAV